MFSEKAMSLTKDQVIFSPRDLRFLPTFAQNTACIQYTDRNLTGKSTDLVFKFGKIVRLFLFDIDK